jgi:hypothetical protein
MRPKTALADTLPTSANPAAMDDGECPSPILRNRSGDPAVHPFMRGVDLTSDRQACRVRRVLAAEGAPIAIVGERRLQPAPVLLFRDPTNVEPTATSLEADISLDGLDALRERSTKRLEGLPNGRPRRQRL